MSGAIQQPGRRLVVLLAVLLALGTAVVYAPALRNGFVNLDDPDYVTRNPYVLHGLTSRDVSWALGSNYPSSNWHPLTWLSHMLDVQLFGANPAGHHFTNVFLHILAVILLFLLIERATGAALGAAAVAGLFAVQPLNVEAVAWVSERKSVLCVVFFLLGIAAYGWYSKKPSVGRYLWVALFFGLGITAKSMVITFPFALLLLDYWPLERLPGKNGKGEPRPVWSVLRRLVLEKIPLFGMAVVGGLITIYVHKREHALGSTMPLTWRLKNGIYSYLAYLGKALWPVRLAPFYPHPENTLTWTSVILAALALVGLSLLVWRFHARKYLVVGWLWYLGTMLPMIGFIQTGRQGMADRFMHIPMIGLLVAIVWLIGDCSENGKVREYFAMAAFVLTALPFAYLTRTQIGYWHDSYTLFAHTLAVTKGNGLAENNFGAALMERGKPELAAQHFVAAVRLIPNLASAHYNLAVLLQQQNRLDVAEREYRAALTLSNEPMELAQSHNNLGVLYMEEQEYSAALAELNTAIAINPDSQNSYLARGTIEMQNGHPDAAIADYSKAKAIAPSPMACFWLGRALEATGKMQQAEEAYEAALRLAPTLTEAKARLEALRTSSGKSWEKPN